MKSKLNLLMAAGALLMAFSAKSQTWTYSSGNTNAYLNPTSSTVTFGTNAVPMAGVKVDIVGGNLRTNLNQILLGTDANHGVGVYNIFTTTGPYMNADINGPVLYGFWGGALGSNQWGTKNIALRWTEIGKVGIGVNTPSARLQINSPTPENSLDVVYNNVVNFRVKSTGFVYARDLTIQAGNFPDYVFAKDYKLMPLAEVNAFIQKNSHLPEMPTAAEVEKDGMSVSQINKLLVQKVEELTLYMIQLQNEVDQLKSQK